MDPESIQAPTEEPVVETEPTQEPVTPTEPQEPAQPAEPELYELPDGRKVDAETLSKECFEQERSRLFSPSYLTEAPTFAKTLLTTPSSFA